MFLYLNHACYHNNGEVKGTKDSDTLLHDCRNEIMHVYQNTGKICIVWRMYYET